MGISTDSLRKACYKQSVTKTELDTLAGVTAGTVTAGKAIVTTTNKHIDALVISDGGLALGAGAGTAVTSTAAELNILDGVTATATEINKVAGVTGGTISASKAVVTGDSGALDLVGTQVAVVANANVIGGIPVMHQINIAAGALGNTDVILTHKTRITDAWLVLTGAGVATTTLQLFNGATAITDAMAASGADKALVRCATLDDAAWEVAAGGTLRVTSATGATQPAATVYVLGYRVA